MLRKWKLGEDMVSLSSQNWLSCQSPWWIPLLNRSKFTQFYTSLHNLYHVCVGFLWVDQLPPTIPHDDWSLNKTKVSKVRVNSLPSPMCIRDGCQQTPFGTRTGEEQKCLQLVNLLVYTGPRNLVLGPSKRRYRNKSGQIWSANYSLGHWVSLQEAR